MRIREIGPSPLIMRISALVLCMTLAACGTRRATITHATIAGASLGIGLVAFSGPPDDCSHSDCDRVGPAIMQGLLVTTAIGFGIAALVSAMITPDDPPPPPPPVRRDGPPGLGQAL